jgi:hypothetical protein
MKKLPKCVYWEIALLHDKINEIIDWINEQEDPDHPLNSHQSEVKECKCYCHKRGFLACPKCHERHMVEPEVKGGAVPSNKSNRRKNTK